MLSLLIVAGAPGSEAYHACAQNIGGRAAEGGSSARAIPVVGLSGLSSPIPSLAPTSLSLSPVVLSAPVVAPEAQVAPVAALAVPTHAAALEAVAVPMGPAQVASTLVPLAYAAKTGPPVVTAPFALTRELSAPAVTGKQNDGTEMFDGASAKSAAATPIIALSRPGAFRRALFSALVVTVGMLGIQMPDARAQSTAMPPPIVQQHQIPTLKGQIAKDIADSLKQQIAEAAKKAQAQVAAATPAPALAPAADTARVVLPRPVEAAVTVDRQGVTVGERINLTITLRNTSDKPVTLQNLRGSIQDALPTDLELQGKGAEAPLTLAPGESKTIIYEAIPFGSGKLTLEGGLAVVTVGETAVYPEGIEIVMPKTEIAVTTVLTPDWKKKGLKDIVGVKRAEGPNWTWLAAIPLGILLFVGVHRLIAARRLYPKLDSRRLSLVTVTETELARLKIESGELDSASFYARYQDLLTGFMIDFAGMPKAARDARVFGRDLNKSFYDAGQIGVAARLAAAAEAARFAGSENDAS